MRTLLSVLLALMLVPALTGCKAPAKKTQLLIKDN